MKATLYNTIMEKMPDYYEPLVLLFVGKWIIVNSGVQTITYRKKSLHSNKSWGSAFGTRRCFLTTEDVRFLCRGISTHREWTSRGKHETLKIRNQRERKKCSLGFITHQFSLFKKMSKFKNFWMFGDTADELNLRSVERSIH